MTDHVFPEAWRRGLYETITRRRAYGDKWTQPTDGPASREISQLVERAGYLQGAS